MKTLVLLIGLCWLNGLVYGQQVKTDAGVWYEPDVTEPQYPGGIEALMAYIKKKQRYPKEARKNSIQGRVLVSFRIDSLGYVPDSTVLIVRGLGYGCDEEAVRLVQNMLRWKPATASGKSFAVTYHIPIIFPPNL